MHSNTKWATAGSLNVDDHKSFIKSLSAWFLAAILVLLLGIPSNRSAFGQSDILLLGRSDSVRVLSPYLHAKNPSLAHVIRTQGVHAVSDVSSMPLLLPLIVDALQSNDSAIRSAATKAISNIVLKLDRNTYRRVPIKNWNAIETQLERANTLLSLQSQHKNLQEEIDGLLRRVNTGEWKRLAKLRVRRSLSTKQLEFIAELTNSSDEGAPQKVHKFEKGVNAFIGSEKRSVLEQLCQQASPSFIEIVILSSDKHDDDFVEALLWLAEENSNATWDVLLASCSPQSNEARKKLTESFLRNHNRPSLRAELLNALSRSHYMEPELARRLLREFTSFIERPRDSDSFVMLGSMSSFLSRHIGSISSQQISELKQIALQGIQQKELPSDWRSCLVGFVADSFPKDIFVADTLANLIKVSESDPSIQFDALAAISNNPYFSQKARQQLHHHAKHGDTPTQELALSGMSIVSDLSPTDLEMLVRIAFGNDGVNQHKTESQTRVLAAKAIASQGAKSVEPLRAILSQNMTRRSDPNDLERVLRTIELAGQKDQELDAMMSQLVKDPFRSLEIRVAAWNARATTALLTDRVMKEIHYYLNDPDYEPEARASALIAMAQICGACSISKLSMYAHDDEPLIRTAARYAHHYTGETATATRLLIDELNSSSSVDGLSMDETTGHHDMIRNLILDLGADAEEALWTILKSEAYNPEQKKIAFFALASNQNNSWKELLSQVSDSDLESQFSREIRAAWNFDSELVPALYAKILNSNPDTPLARELWQIAEDTTLGLGAGDDLELWGDNSIRVAISNYASQTRSDAPAVASLPEPVQPIAPDLSKTTPPPAPQETTSAIATNTPGNSQTEATLESKPNAAPERSAANYTAKPTRLMALNQNVLNTDTTSTGPVSHERLVNVFYGTNRQLRAIPNLGGTLRWGAFALSLACFLVCVVKFAKQRSMKFAIIALLGLMGLTSMARDSLDMAYWFPNRTALFTGEYSSEIKYGVCEVSIPPIHTPGELESPSLLLKWEVVEDPEKHIVLKSTQPLDRDDFFNKLQHTLDTKGKSLLVFVHGYNVSFDDAARRTAQMAYDLKFPGAPVFYSWPSYNNWYRYPDDKANIERSVDQIKDFLQQLAIDSKAESINLIAHSMGNVGLTQALAKIASDRPLFNQVVLAAPDIDADVFRNSIAPRITNKANRFTLYTSKNDLALVASRFFNSSGRLGDSREGPIAVPGIDTIDASDIDTSLLGHSYYGSNTSVLDDIASLLLGKPLTERSYLKAQNDAKPPYWIFDPASSTIKRTTKGTDPITR